MRTTLSIDDDVLQAIKERARHEKRSAGAVASDLMRDGLTAPSIPEQQNGEDGTEDRPFVMEDGFPVLPGRGRVVTNEMVNRIRDELGI